VDSVTTDQFTLALERLGHLREIYLSGGEPFEHPALAQLITIARERADQVVLYSSGVVDTKEPAPLSHDAVREVARLGVHRVDVSLYADNPEAHEMITATPGSWAAAVESIRRLQSAGVAVGIHHVPVLPHAHVLRGVAQLAEGLRVRRLHVLALAAQGRGTLLGPSSLPQEWRDEARILGSGSATVDIVLSSRIRQQLGLEHSTERDSWVALFIDYRGRIYPGEGSRQVAVRSGFSLFDAASLVSMA
jgi:MoaA/NifB/PqqE/SkfB family radical SAM enzyme